MISETRRRLKEWGLWACGGEPALSSMWRSMFGRGAQDLREMPQHIQEIDHIICSSPSDIRAILIKFYTTSGSYYEKAEALGLDKRTFKRRLDRADYYANSRLDDIPQQGIALPRNGLGHLTTRIDRADALRLRAQSSTARGLRYAR